MKQVDLRKYSNSWYHPGNAIKRILWYAVNVIFFRTPVAYPVKLKTLFLKVFGAKIGKGLVIKPYVNIKYPWFLEIGDNTWIGEGLFIDNLGRVSIGNNVCISQNASLLTGSHNYKHSAFDLIIGKIDIKDGAWIGAGAIVCPGVTCGSYSVLTAGSVATHDLEPYKIYQGNPAVYKRDRIIEK